MEVVYNVVSVVGNSSVPFDHYIASGWEYMTNNYSRFTIATCFSALLHEVCTIETYVVYDNQLTIIAGKVLCGMITCNDTLL